MPAPVSVRSLAGLALLVAAFWGASQWWAARQKAGVAEQVVAQAKPGDIQMLSSETCAICTVARRWFTQHGVPFNECFIKRDSACRSRFEAARAPGTPVLLVHGRTQLGFNPDRLLRALQQR